MSKPASAVPTLSECLQRNVTMPFSMSCLTKYIGEDMTADHLRNRVTVDLLIMDSGAVVQDEIDTMDHSSLFIYRCKDSYTFLDQGNPQEPTRLERRI